jgi:hypothetical protein
MWFIKCVRSISKSPGVLSRGRKSINVMPSIGKLAGERREEETNG